MSFTFAWEMALFLTPAAFPWGSRLGMEFSSALLPVTFSIVVILRAWSCWPSLGGTDLMFPFEMAFLL